MADRIVMEVSRYRPEIESAPVLEAFEVPLTREWAILDGLNYIKDQLDGTLSFRWSCRMGICGSCGMTINGDPKLGCATFLVDYLPGPVRVEPMRNFPVIRDLVVDISDFMTKLPRVKPWIIREDERPVEDGEYLQTPAELDEYKKFSMCINCMLCYSACPVYALDPDVPRSGGDRAGSALQPGLARRRRGGSPGRTRRGGGRVGVHAGGRMLDGVSEGRRSGRCNSAIQADRGNGLGEEAAATQERAMTTPVRAYRQPVSRYWWTKRRSYLLFMLREISCVFVAWSVVYLLLLVHAIGAGQDSYARFLDWSGNPLVVAAERRHVDFRSPARRYVVQLRPRAPSCPTFVDAVSLRMRFLRGTTRHGWSCRRSSFGWSCHEHFRAPSKITRAVPVAAVQRRGDGGRARSARPACPVRRGVSARVARRAGPSAPAGNRAQSADEACAVRRLRVGPVPLGAPVQVHGRARAETGPVRRL